MCLAGSGIVPCPSFSVPHTYRHRPISPAPYSVRANELLGISVKTRELAISWRLLVGEDRTVFHIVLVVPSRPGCTTKTRPSSFHRCHTHSCFLSSPFPSSRKNRNATKAARMITKPLIPLPTSAAAPVERLPSEHSTMKTMTRRLWHCPRRMSLFF